MKLNKIRFDEIIAENLKLVRAQQLLKVISDQKSIIANLREENSQYKDKCYI